MAANRYGGLTEDILNQYQAKAGQSNALTDKKLAESFWGFADSLGGATGIDENTYRGSVSGLLRNLVAKQVDINKTNAEEADQVNRITESKTDPAAQQRLGLPRRNIGRSANIFAGGQSGTAGGAGLMTASRFLLGA